jgi:hypothetical protein
MTRGKLLAFDQRDLMADAMDGMEDPVNTGGGNGFSNVKLFFGRLGRDQMNALANSSINHDIPKWARVPR